MGKQQLCTSKTKITIYQHKQIKHAICKARWWRSDDVGLLCTILVLELKEMYSCIYCNLYT